MNGYVFPYSSRVPVENANPYILNFIKALSANMNIVNREKPSSKGIFDVFSYRKEIDVVFFHWVENIAERKAGLIQVLFFVFLLQILKLRKIKIVYVLHNKLSHSRKKLIWKKLVFNKILKKSDFIITHSKEGLDYLSNISEKIRRKAMFFHHPADSAKAFIPEEKSFKKRKYDVLIWGTMSPYKGIDKFFSYLNELLPDNEFKILVAGKFSDQAYFQKVDSIKGKAEIKNNFVSKEDLEEYMSNSRIILFTYNHDSVLSSGALIDSLYAPSILIGPHTGSFKDLKEEGLVETFIDFPGLVDQIRKIINQDILVNTDKKQKFMEENSWSEFGKKINTEISKQTNQ